MSQTEAHDVLESAVKNQPKKRGCRRGCVIWFLVLGVTYWWFGCHTTPLRVSKETTYALGPMTADGKRIDYFRAMEERYYPPQMKTDDNGYRLLVRALGDMVDRGRERHDPKTGEMKYEKPDSEPFRIQVYEKLGLDPNVKPTMKKIESPYVCFSRYEKKHKPADGEQTQYDIYRTKSFWTFDDFPMLKDWLDENSAGIDLIGEAVRKPAFRIPWVRENENTPIFEAALPLPEVQVVREWARAVQGRVQYRLGIGDIDGAIDDIITIHLLARHAGKQGTLVAGLVGLAIEGNAYGISGIGCNPKFPPTKAQIERLLKEIDALPPRMTFEECIESERYFGLAAMQDQYWGNVAGYPDGSSVHMGVGAFMQWTVDINIFMARANKIYDALVKQTTVDRKSLEDALKPSWNPLPLFFVRSRSNQIMDIQASLLFTSVQAAHEGWRGCECKDNIQHLTLALLLYEKDHGKLPGEDVDWREAVKPYLGKDPEKYFRCPTRGLAEGETTYAMIGGPGTQSPTRLLIVEVFQPQKLGEGNGRFPFEKAVLWKKDPMQPNVRCPDDFDGLGSFHPNGRSNVGYRSGASRDISEKTSPEELQKLLDGTATTVP